MNFGRRASIMGKLAAKYISYFNTNLTDYCKFTRFGSVTTRNYSININSLW